MGLVELWIEYGWYACMRKRKEEKAERLRGGKASQK